MDKKETLLNILEHTDAFISGSELAARLGVTRAAVWKYIRMLEGEGCEIEAVTNRGYRLSPSNDMITAESIRRELGELSGQFSIEVVRECTSTNSVLKEKAAGLPEWYTLIAGSQSEGRGRRNRSFHSPAGTGLYMSVLLRPQLPIGDAVLITAAAAVAVCRAVEELSGVCPGIKWVNDILLYGRKICGILSEASLDMESGAVESVILGVGINVTPPAEGFPPALSDTAGAVFPNRQRNMRSRMAAAFLRHFFRIYADFPNRGFVPEYRSLNVLPGRRILVLQAGGSSPAAALDIDDRCRLIVRYDDGTQQALSSGEVSVLPD